MEFNSECKAVDSDVESTQVIGRQVFRCDGVYVKGQVHEFDINFTVDTGAARTVLSTQTFRRIPQFKRPNLKKSHTLASVNGEPLQEIGKAIFVIKLGKFNFETELIVADIEDEALLGLSILMKVEWGTS